ncbi:glycosyltransferase family 2 protein [Flavobacterium eburneipallidum]|uniref:glycosyltransferase family 2 protein n=1 Tax=Flavobacterium eburneipallidum TaxID=3003263 RepID=UPI0024827558|nr:glycosyltransferase family 2 protein [Flavobacterium eburneipallidum]
MKISVALCTYNGSKYLTKQIESILNQEGTTPDEIIICDDKSTDETLKIITKYKDFYPDIFKIFINDVNLGSTKNFEKAISLCSGDYIFLSDQDDIWKKNKIQKTVAIFNQNPNAEGVFSNADLIDQNNDPIESLTIWESVFFLEKELPKPIDYFNILSKNGNIATGATMCIKSSIKEFIFPFDGCILHDERIANILALRKSLFYSTENLISYRIHDKQQIGMKNIDRIIQKNRLKRIILDLDKPVTFTEYRHLFKKKYLKFKKAKKFQNHILIKKERQNLISNCHKELSEINIEMKSKFLLRHTIFKLMDQILGKRKY